MNEHTNLSENEHRETAPGGVKKKVLVCDDEDAIRLLIAEALRDTYEIVQVNDGREAVRMVAKEPFDLLITDIKMPGTHGLEAIERIRERNASIPIIICSAFRLLEDNATVKCSNVAAFFTKPIDLKLLRTKVFELIGA